MNKCINIVRSQPRHNYTVLPNALANDENLSAPALGVICYVLPKPPNWNVNPHQLGKRFGMSYRRILNVLRELKKAGYVKSETVRDRGRIVGIRYIVADEPWDITDVSEGQEKLGLEEPENEPTENIQQSKKGGNHRVSIFQHAEKRHAYKEKIDNKTPLTKTSPPDARVPAAGLAKEPYRRQSRKSADNRTVFEIKRGTPQWNAWMPYLSDFQKRKIEKEGRNVWTVPCPWPSGHENSQCAPP
jgi:hypothetical protein